MTNVNHQQQQHHQQEPASASSKAVAQSKARAFDLVYRATHRDYKGVIDGVRSLMSWAKYGGGVVTVETITDEELTERVAAVRKEKNA